MIWYFQDHRRSRLERESLEALVSKVDWLIPVGWRIDSDLRLIWDADIATAERIFPISLRYPSHFPHSPPVVLPRDKTERWSDHQYVGGELCLEYGPDNWHADLTGADMIASAHRLLQGEHPAQGQQGVVASRHHTTLGQDLRGRFTRLLITSTLADVLAGIPEDTMLSANALGMFHADSYVNVIASITLADGNSWRDTIPEPLKESGYEHPIVLFRWPADAPLPPIGSLTEFRAAIAEHGFVLPSVSDAIIVHRSGIRAFFLWEKKDKVIEASVIPPQPLAPRMDEDHTALAERKVAIVGCGSLGSKVAVMLARTGVGKFILVDDDLLLPDNFVRHDLDWRDVATHKADSVASRIQLVNPAAVCEKRKHRLGGQEASGSVESLIESLAECDLLINATAEPSVFNYLCATVSIAKRPLLWAEVFGGGFGGLVARHRPLVEPAPASIRRAIEAWCAERGKPIERAANRYGGGPKAAAIADDADVTVISAHAARMAIDLLIPRVPSAFPNSAYLIGLAKGWIFEQPFETYPIEVGPPEAPKPQDSFNPKEAAQELARIMQLFSEHKDAASSGATDTQTPQT